jgi:O-succinylhomoserine sulfhydrylase
MRASFAEEKIETSIAVTATKYKWVCEKVCKMEGATAGFATSGMAAVYSTMALLKSGDHIVSSSSVFWGNPFIVCELFPQVEYRNHLFWYQ